jgi:wyosine [tRNA(Phe)-imidazoG37] synthetase (radical SAM superfamily)
MKVDQNILKLDSAIDQTINIHNQPRVKTSAAEIIGNLGFFKGNLIIQTLFLRGLCDGRIIDNTTEAELDALLKVFEKIRPAEVMIYTISRDTPSDTQLKKVPLEELDCIAALIEKLGIKTQVSG